ncbi:hypothetical protein [Nonomuraea sp. NPDC052265]|uniref:hypothetical protein n=1 Tax=Nonomuraea sp. NPDC052265 TaxID=3364374 RepID=UPI0037CAB6C0
MSPAFFTSDLVLDPQVWHANKSPRDLYSYEEHLGHGMPMVSSGRPDIVEQGRWWWPDGYRLVTNEWGAETRTPVYAASTMASCTSGHGARPDLLVHESMTHLREGLRARDVVFLAGRTAECCGRISELAVFDKYGRPLFNRAMAPQSGEDYDERKVDKWWPCASKHTQWLQRQQDVWCGPFSHWALQFSLFLRYNNRDVEIAGLEARGGRRRSRIVVWGTSLLQALHREYAFAHGHPRNGRLQDVKDALRKLPMCDLQEADLLWRGAGQSGVVELAHLDGATAAEDCRLMYEHLQLLKQDTDQLRRNAAFRTGPPQTFIMASAPAAETLGEREGWTFRDGRIELAEAPQLLLPVQETLADPGELSRTTGLDLEGATDILREVTQRREQTKLRRHLLGGRTSGVCALCGRTLPIAYLHVAHIKRRDQADEKERRDTAIVMLACVLGCDALFEQGAIYVDAQGLIRTCPTQALSSDLSAAVNALEGRRCTAHSSRSERYFHAHREHHANGTPAPPCVISSSRC